MKDFAKQHTKQINMMPSTIENIDYAIYDWLNEKMNVFATFKDGWKKVEVVWVSAERAILSKKSKESREKNGTLVLPLITVERKNINKDLSKKGIAICNIPLVNDEKGGSITIARRIKQDKTNNFVSATTKRRFNQNYYPNKVDKVVYETITIPMPVYVEVMYEIKVKCLYQQQMNEVVQPFMTKTLGINYFVLRREGHRYESFMDGDFQNNSNVSNMDQNERIYETSFGVKVLGYLIGADKNEEYPKMTIRENAVEVRIGREHVVFGDKTVEGKDYVGIGGLMGGKSKRDI